MTGHSSGAVVLHPLIPMDDIGSVAHLRHKCKYIRTLVSTHILKYVHMYHVGSVFHLTLKYKYTYTQWSKHTCTHSLIAMDDVSSFVHFTHKCPVYSKPQHQHRVNARMTLVTYLS